MDSKLLSQLRDIHLPTAISWWPLAPGWYIIIALSMMIIAFFAIRYWRIWKFRQQAINAVTDLAHEFTQSQYAPSIIAKLNKLLKQMALTCSRNPSVASLYGQAWLEYLDQTGKTHAFTQGAGRLLISTPYQHQNAKNALPLFKLAEKWIRRQRRCK